MSLFALVWARLSAGVFGANFDVFIARARLFVVTGRHVLWGMIVLKGVYLKTVSSNEKKKIKIQVVLQTFHFHGLLIDCGAAI